MIIKIYKSFVFFLLLINLLLSGNSATFAQNKNIITNLNDAISLALSNNSNLIVARLDKLKAEQKVSEVYSENLVPTITLNSRYSRSFKKQTFIIDGEKFEISSDNSLINNIDVTQSLPILGTPIFSGIRIAEYFLKTQTENVIAVQNDVKANVKKAYYGVLLAKAVYDVTVLSFDNANENFQVVDARYRNGVATEFDFLRSKVRVENIKPILSKSQSDYEISQKVLINAIGLKAEEEIEVAGNITYDSNEVWQSTDYVINKISEENVLVRQLLINKKINEEFVKVDQANYLPKVYLFGQYGLSTQENDNRPVSRYRFYNTLNAGLGLSWDLNLFRNTYRKNQSEIEVKKSEERIRETKQQLKLTSESVLIALEDAKQRIISQKQTLNLAERGLYLADVSYRAGTLNQIDVRDAELTLYQSRLSYLQATYDYLIAKAELEKLLER